MRALLMALALAMIALSGCASEPAPEENEPTTLSVDEDPAPEEPTQDGDPEPEPTSEPEPEPEPGTEPEPENQPPTLEFTADVVEGTVPLTVIFNLTGSDPDGDAIRWTIDVESDDSPDDFGDSLPATVEVVYDAVGNYTATATIEAGEHTVTKQINITVQEVPEAPREESTYKCTTTAGAVVISLTTGAVNVGGCNLVTISGDQEVMSVDPAAFCNIQVDVDGDGFSDEDAEVGKVFASGSSFTAFCEPGAVNAESAVTLAPVQ